MAKTLQAQSTLSRAPLVDSAIALYQADLTPNDFEAARGLMPGLGEYASYEDWRDEREGVCIGLSHAGVSAHMTPIRLERFLDWRRVAGRDLECLALDDFAELVAVYRAAPEWPCLAEIAAGDFAKYGATLPATAAFGSYEAWGGHRSQWMTPNEARAHRLIVSAPDFLDWARCLSVDANEVNLDVYAGLRMEFLAEAPWLSALTTY